MLKNFIVILAVAALTFTGFLYYADAEWFPDLALPNVLTRGGQCAFDNPKIIDKQQITESDRMRVFINYRPITEGSILILPKRHVERLEDLTPEEWIETGELIKEFQKRFSKVYGQSDYVIVVQNGYYGGQTVPHAHFHMIPRGTESTLMKKIQLWNLFLTEKLGNRHELPEDEIQRQIQRLQ